jgi:Fe2+ or Zn2+ uptake regulation protein
MMNDIGDIREFFSARGLNLTPQRIAVADIILQAQDHPSAKTVLQRVRDELPSVSTATVYNTLHLLVKHGVITELHADAGHVLYDPDTTPHHHFIDEKSGHVLDIPWDKVQLPDINLPKKFDVRNYSIIFRGTCT